MGKQNLKNKMITVIENFEKQWLKEKLNEHHAILDGEYANRLSEVLISAGVKDSDFEPILETINSSAWEEFRDTGLLWWINQQLHLFGYAICVNFEKGKITAAYPAKTESRGFDEKNNAKGYEILTQYLKNNIDTFMKIFDKENKEKRETNINY